MTTLSQDMRYGLRLLWKNPVLHRSSASPGFQRRREHGDFRVVNADLSRSLPFSHPDRLVKIVANDRRVKT